MPYLNSDPRPIAYTYDADTHCPACAEARFGRCADGFVACCTRDSEGNGPGAIFSWDEWCEPSEPGMHILACGTCGGVIREHDSGIPPRYGEDCIASERDAEGVDYASFWDDGVLGGEA
jgi:hypothetical protein